MAGFLKRVGADRLGGQRPSAPQAMLAAAVAGVGAAVVTYKFLRS